MIIFKNMSIDNDGLIDSEIESVSNKKHEIYFTKRSVKLSGVYAWAFYFNLLIWVIIKSIDIFMYVFS